MKKKIILLVMLVLMLVGCKHDKFYFEDELYENGTITEISVKELKKLEKEKKNFGLFVYLPGCTSCAEFKEVLNEYIKDNKIEFYAISILECEDTSVSKKIKFAPSMMLYHEGKVVEYLDSSTNEDKPPLTEVQAFIDWLEENIYVTKKD